MNKKQKKAWKESAITVGSGLIINWPISVFFLYLFIEVMELDILTTSVFMTIGFTFLALIRVYVIRMIFERDEEWTE